ncbi:MAG: aldolase/citrate lyase family protein, partial [Acidobacteria bacterium]|nr:aldolase/citrate lyase family protein [Acidobacteriota bacterium]
AQTLARTDLDFLLIDMEHTPYDAGQLQVFLLGLTDKQTILKKGNLQPNVVPFVRVPQYGDENLPLIIKQVLDVGVFGIMFPHVNTAAQALAAVQSCRYPQQKGAADFQPLGHRGNAPTNAVWYWGLPGREYADRADVWPLDSNGELLLSIQIETPEAVANIDAITNVPGVGVVFVGPNDLSFNLGNPGNADTPEEETAIQKVLQICLKKNIPVGITAYTPDLVTRRLKEGFRFIAIGQEIGLTPAIDASLKAGRAFAKSAPSR